MNCIQILYLLNYYGLPSINNANITTKFIALGFAHCPKHSLIEYPPKLSVSKIVNALKGGSSLRYGQAGFKKPKNGKALWSPSYFAVSVGGAPIKVLIKYIKEQQRPTGRKPS